MSALNLVISACGTCINLLTQIPPTENPNLLESEMYVAADAADALTTSIHMCIAAREGVFL